MIVYQNLLLELFAVCNEPSCGSACDPENVKISYSGAMITVTSTCNGNHERTWRSSPRVGSGKQQVASVNILLGTNAYLCGLGVNRVLYIFM